MQRIQEKLLEMLQEIDEVCRANDIKYFIDGGTCLGAVRHEGFIPWDNDADVVMTEENYYKFVEAVNRDTDKTHRMVQDCRLDRDYATTFGRYINLDTTKITKNTPFWNDESTCAGLMIDVFILFPLPPEEPARTEYMNLLAVYDEYHNNFTRHTAKRNEDFVRTYREAQERAKSVGQLKVVEEMEARLLNQGLTEFDEYVYCSSPRMYLRTFPRWMFDCDQVYVPFETAMLPIPEYYHEEMRHFYGEDYFMIPGQSGQKVHAEMNSENIPSKYFARDYMRFIDADRIKADRKALKAASVEEGFIKKEWEEKVIDMTSRRVAADILRKIRREDIDLEKALANKNWELLNDLFKDYYRYQFSIAYGYWYRFIELPDDVMYAALMNLILQNGSYGKVSRMMTRYREHISRDLNPGLQRIQDLFDAIFAVTSAREYGRLDEGLEALERAEAEYPDNREVRVERLRYDILTSGRTAKELHAEAAALLEVYPGNEDVIKADADIMWDEGHRDEAGKIYDEIYAKTRNGFTQKDIRRRRKA